MENVLLIEYQMFRYNRLDTRPFLAAVLELCSSEKSFWQRIIPQGKQRMVISKERQTPVKFNSGMKCSRFGVV